MLWDIYTTASGLPILRFGEGNGGATTAIAVVGYILHHHGKVKPMIRDPNIYYTTMPVQ